MTHSTGSDAIQPASVRQRFAERILQLPRLARIALAALFAAVTTLLLTPIIDNIYLTYFFDFNTRVLPSLVSTAAGIVTYLVGWVLLVGYAGEGVRPRRATFWYFVAGCAELAFVVLLLMTGTLDMAR